MDAQQRRRLGIDTARQQTKLIRELRDIRRSSGMSVADVAAAMEVDPAVIYRFEKGGTNPTMATVRRYALAVHAMVQFSAIPWRTHRSHTVQEATAAIESDPRLRREFATFVAQEIAPVRVEPKAAGHNARFIRHDQ